LEVIADYCLHFGQFASLFGGLGATYTAHLRIIGKLSTLWTSYSC